MHACTEMYGYFTFDFLVLYLLGTISMHLIIILYDVSIYALAMIRSLKYGHCFFVFNFFFYTDILFIIHLDFLMIVVSDCCSYVGI